MKTLIGAIALTLAVPAFAQTAPAADPHAQHKGMDQSQHQGMDHSKHQDQAKHMEEMHKHCQEMMKHHGKDHGAKTGESGTRADGGHSRHAH